MRMFVIGFATGLATAAVVMLFLLLLVGVIGAKTEVTSSSHSWGMISTETQDEVTDAIKRVPLVLKASLDQQGPDLHLEIIHGPAISGKESKGLIEKAIEITEEATSNGMYNFVIRTYYLNDAAQDGHTPVPDEFTTAEGLKDFDSDDIEWRRSR